MNAHVHPAFHDVLATACGSAMTPSQKLHAEIDRMERNLEAIQRRLGKLVPDIELSDNRTGDPQLEELVTVPSEVVEEAVEILVDRNIEQIEEICRELRARDNEIAGDDWASSRASA